MTKKDYIAIAEILNHCINKSPDEIDGCIDGWLEAVTEIADELALLFKRDNSKFDIDRFMAACDILPK